MSTLPPLPVENYVDADGLWAERYGPYTAEQMQDYAREAVRLAMAEPVAWWIPKAEQFSIAKPGERPFAKAWEPLYAGSGVTK